MSSSAVASHTPLRRPQMAISWRQGSGTVQPSLCPARCRRPLRGFSCLQADHRRTFGFLSRLEFYDRAPNKRSSVRGWGARGKRCLNGKAPRAADTGRPKSMRMIAPSRDAQARLDCPAASVPGRPVDNGEQCVDIKRKVSSETGSAATFTGAVHIDRPIAPSSGRGGGLESCHLPAWRADRVSPHPKGRTLHRRGRRRPRSARGRAGRRNPSPATSS